MRFIVIDRNQVPVHPLFENEGLASRLDMLFDQRVRGIHRDVRDRRGIRVVRHLQTQRIVCIQHRCIGRDFDRHALNIGKIFKRVHATQAKVILRHVETAGDITLLKTEAAAQHAAAGCFHDRRVDRRIAQDHLCRHGSPSYRQAR